MSEKEKNQYIEERMQCIACEKNDSCNIDRAIFDDENDDCNEFKCSIKYCDNCYALLKRYNDELWCENCGLICNIMDDINEDALEENGIDYSQYPDDNDNECQCNKCTNQYCQMKVAKK